MSEEQLRQIVMDLRFLANIREREENYEDARKIRERAYMLEQVAETLIINIDELTRLRTELTEVKKDVDCVNWLEQTVGMTIIDPPYGQALARVVHRNFKLVTYGKTVRDAIHMAKQKEDDCACS